MPNPIVLRRLRTVDNTLVIYTAADNTSTFDPSWAFAAGGGPMTVDWGDGTPKEIHATGLSHTYLDGSIKAARFTCPNWRKATTFNVNADVCRKTLPSFAACTALVVWYGNANQFSGVLPSFAACTALTDWRGHMNQFSGILPSFAACTALVVWYGYSNQFSGYKAGGFATQRDLATLRLETNLLPQAAVDAVLADLVTSLGISGRVVCTVGLSGTGNAAPSNPDGLASKATLVAAGWTVTTN